MPTKGTFMTTAVQILTDAGVQNADAIVRAATDSGLPLGIAVALIAKESNGANVYGHDTGGALCGAGEVTQDNFTNQFLPAVLGGATSNGVGLTQITYPGYFRQHPDLAWWDPYTNAKFGFDLMKGYLGGDYSDASLVAAGSTYNSGSATGAPAYGQSFRDLAVTWTAKLSGSDETAGAPAPEPAPEPAPAQPAGITGDTYIVQPGDTLGSIATRSGHTVAELASWSGISDPDHIEASWTIRLSGGSASSGGNYTIQSGDTLTSIAAAHGTTVAAIVSANGIADPNTIWAGQTITIPTGSASPAPAQRRYTVQPGDTLWAIAASQLGDGARYGEIAAVNSITDPDSIQAGQSLLIP